MVVLVGGKFWNACIVDKDKFVKQSNANLIPRMVRWWKSQKYDYSLVVFSRGLDNYG